MCNSVLIMKSQNLKIALLAVISSHHSVMSKTLHLNHVKDETLHLVIYDYNIL